MVQASLRSQGKGCCLALLLILIASLFLMRGIENARVRSNAEVGVEHEKPLTLSLTLSLKSSASLIEIESKGEEEIFLSVPEEWRREEVRGTPLPNVTPEPPEFGFIRWKVPKLTTIRFSTRGVVQSLTLHNPSEVPLKVELTRIDLQKNAVRSDVILVQKGPVVLFRETPAIPSP